MHVLIAIAVLALVGVIMIEAPDLWWLVVSIFAGWVLLQMTPQDWEEAREREIARRRREAHREIEHRRRVEIEEARARGRER